MNAPGLNCSPGGAAFRQARDFLLQCRDDYREAVRGFHWPVLDRFNWALDYFDVIAAGNSAPALHIVEEDGRECVRSFAEMSARSSQVANFLSEHGVGRGDRLFLMLGNEVALWETLLAAMKLGAVVVPATTLLTASDLRDRFSRGNIRHVVASSEGAPKFDEVPGNYTRIAVGPSTPGWVAYDESSTASEHFIARGETRADEPFLLYFTSGTTATPKMVLHSHQSYPVGHLSTMYWIGLQPGDVHWNISSPGWAKHAWSCVFAPWNAGATVFIYNYVRFRAADVLQAIVQYRVTSLCAPPTVWRMLVHEPLATYKVDLCKIAGAGEPLNPEVIEEVKGAWGLTIRDGFGQTETTAVIGNSPGQPVKPGSMGRPLPGYKIVLLGPDGNPEAEGEICLDLAERPCGLMLGYDDDPARTAEVMGAGYYHTGDVATTDADGYITYIGRVDDVFKASDYRISPFELESVLIEHEAVSEAAIVPSPDAIRHSVPKAYVALAPGYTPSRELACNILQFTRNRLAPYKRIRRVEFADLPKTISGKIRRGNLRARERELRENGVRAPLEFFEDDFS